VYVADFAGFYPKNRLITLELRDGGSITLRAGTTDRGTFNEIWLKDMYAPDGFAIEDGMNVVDIGAHVGCFATWAARSTPSGTVVAIEPSRENFSLLARNARQAATGNVMTREEAVAGEPGTVSLFISDRDPDCHNIFVDESGESEQVRAVTLAQVIEEAGLAKVDYLKIDCEGAEYGILFGADPELLKTIRLIALEVHVKRPDHDPARLEEWLRSLGFETSRDSFMLYARHAA